MEPPSPGRPAWLLPAGAAAALLVAVGTWALVGGKSTPEPASVPPATAGAVMPAVARQTLPALADTPMPAIVPPAVVEPGDEVGSPPDATGPGTEVATLRAAAAPAPATPPAAPPASLPSPAAPAVTAPPRSSAPPTAMLAAASPADVLAADRSSRAGTGPALPATPANPSREQAPAAAVPAGPGGGGATAMAPDTGTSARSPAPAPPSVGGGADTRVDPDGDVPAGEVRMASLEMKRYVEPTYPRNAAQHRVSGWVDVGFAVDERGRPADLRILAAEPPGEFEEAALVAVERWRFEKSDGRNYQPGTRTRVRVRFQPD